MGIKINNQHKLESIHKQKSEINARIRRSANVFKTEKVTKKHIIHNWDWSNFSKVLFRLIPHLFVIYLYFHTYTLKDSGKTLRTDFLHAGQGSRLVAVFLRLQKNYVRGFEPIYDTLLKLVKRHLVLYNFKKPSLNEK